MWGCGRSIGFGRASPYGCRIAPDLATALKSKQSPAEGDFLFEIDPEPLEECVTALGGLPLFVRAVGSLDVPGSVKRNLHLKQRERGLDEAAYVESFLVLNAVGGDCLEDFRRNPRLPAGAGAVGGDERGAGR